MAGLSETFEFIVKTTTDQASQGISAVKGQVGEAEGAFGKLKAAGSGALDAIGLSTTALATGGAAAIAGFVGSAVGKFTELAETSGNAAQQMGTSVEEASRWVEVSGDLGVSIDTVAGAAQRLNREAAAGKLAQYGIDAQDSNERLLETLEYLSSIPDEADRAKAQFELLGKGGAALTPLIGRVDELRGRLADVNQQQLISDSDLENARRFQDNVDNLSDSWSAFTDEVGRDVVPTLADLAGSIGDLIKAGDELANLNPLSGGGGLIGMALNPIQDLTNGFSALTSGSSSFTDRLKGLANVSIGTIPVLGNLTGSLFDVDNSAKNADSSTAGAAASAEELAKQAEEAAKQVQDLADQFLSQEQAALRAKQQQDQIALALSNGSYQLDDIKGKFLAYAQTLEKEGGNPAAIEGLEKLRATVAPGSPLAVWLDGVIGQLTDIGNTNAQAKVSANTDPAEAAITEANRWLDRFGLRTATAKADVDNSPAERAIGQVNHWLDLFGLRHATATASVSQSTTTAPKTASASSSLPDTRALGAAAPMALEAGTPALPGASSGGSGQTLVQYVYYDVTVNVPPLTPLPQVGAYVADALDAHERRNGSRRRVAA